MDSHSRSYEQRLSVAAASSLGPDWQDYWPSLPEAAYFIAHHSERHSMKNARDLVQVAAQDLRSEKQAMCVIENITYSAAIELGSAWDIDPIFFIEHLRPLGENATQRSLKEARVPNSSVGMKSSYGSKKWGTIRGWVDHGKLPDERGDLLTANTSRRCVELSERGTYLAHTTFSFYKVNAKLCEYLPMLGNAA